MFAMDIKEIRRLNFGFMVEKFLTDKVFETQKDMATAMGLANGSYITHLKTGDRGIDDSKARELETFFKLPRYAFDIPMGEPIISDGYMENGILRPSSNHLSLVRADGSSDFVDTSAFVLVPQFDVKGACGLGYSNPDELIKGGLVFKESWLRSKGISPKYGCSAILGGDGESMIPTIHPDNILLANLSINTYEQIVSDRVYAFVAEKELRIKRLFKKGGRLRIVSDNTNKVKYPDEFMDKEEIDSIKFIGHLPWRAGDIQ